MDLIILDLEWNASYSRKNHGFVNEIIEFGAVKCDKSLNTVSTFSSFVKLQIGKKVSGIVSELTSISSGDLQDAKPYMQVVSKFKKWAGDSLIGTWGTSDILTLIDNCRYYTGEENIPFLHNYIDLQQFCQTRLGISTKDQLGLSNAAELAGVDVSAIKHHRALGDSMIALEILKKLKDRERVSEYAENADCAEFYRKMTFRTNIICDIRHPLISENKKQMNFLCEKCGAAAVRSSQWNLRNKKFCAEFRCPECGYEFSGRIQFKEKYEGLVITKKSVSLPKIEKPRDVSSDCAVGGMNLHLKNGVGFLSFPNWEEKLPGIVQAFSTRLGGVSEGKFASMNLGLARGDDDSNVFENFSRMTAAIGVNPELMVTGAQDHHTNIRRVGTENAGTGIYKAKDMQSIDGLCTDEKGVCLVIYAADCVPLYFYDPVHEAIGLAHAGWRGTVHGMAKVMVEKMQAEFGTKPEDIIAGVGPSIGPENFEVDPPCAEEFLNLPESESFVRDDKNGKFHVNLWECNRRFLISAGVLPENITVGEVCTVDNSDLIFSHRVTRGERGSNAAFLSMK